MTDSSARLTRRPFQVAGIAVMVGTFALTAACSSSGSSSGGGGGTAGSTPPAALTKFFPGKKATGAPVKIGFINPQGGPVINQPEDRAAGQAVVQYANSELGGIGGRPIQLDTCNNFEDPASARGCANQMVADKVAAVIVATTAQGSVMQPIISGAGIPYVSASGAATQELDGKDTFLWTSSFPGALADMVSKALAAKYTYVNAFVENTPVVVGGMNLIAAPAFAKAQVKFTVTPINEGTADPSPQVSSVLQNKPDVNIIIGDGTLCTSVLKALGTVGAGSTAKTWVIQPCLDPAVVSAVGTTLNGATDFGTADVDSSDPEAQLYRYIMARWASGTSTEGYAQIGYQSTLGLVRMTAGLTGAVTPASIIAAIQSAKNVPLPIGHGLVMNCNGKQTVFTAICSPGAMSATVENGKEPNVTVFQGT